MKRSMFLIFLSILCAAWMFSGSVANSQEAPKRGGVLVIAHADDPAHYDLHQTGSFRIGQPLGPAYSTLLQFDPFNYPKIIGDLAKEWEISQDGLIYRFKLRPNIHFHDGSLLISADVKASLERVKNPPEGVVGQWTHLFETVERIETPDDLTVVIYLSRPTPSFFTHMANPFLVIYSKAMMEQDKNYPKKKVMGTGPFKLKKHVPNVSFELERFDNYFIPDRPYMDGVRFDIIRDTQARAATLISGRADAEIRSLPTLVVEQIQKVAGDRIRVVKTDWLTTMDFVFNVKQKPFDDIRVRLAINYAIDIYEMVEEMRDIMGIGSIGAWSRPNTFWEMPEKQFQNLPGWSPDAKSNRKKARQLLAEAGYAAGLRLKLINRSVAFPWISWGVYVIEQLARVGITVEHNVVDTGKWVKSFRNLKEGEMVTTFIAPPYDDPDVLFGARVPGSKANLSNYEDPEVRRLFDLQSRTTDPVKRREIVWQLESLIWKKSYWGKGCWLKKNYVLSQRIQNYVPHPNHFTNVRFCDVWLSQ